MTRRVRRLAAGSWLLIAQLCIYTALPGAAVAEPLNFDIAAGPAPDALSDFGRQSGLQLLFEYEVVKDLRTQPVRGDFEPKDALARLLQASGLVFEFVNERAVSIRLANSKEGGTSRKRSAVEELDVVVDKVPEIIVAGSKILNMDIRRSRDDTQPYVVYERESIERSGAANLNDFLKQRLPMNTVAATNGQVNTTDGGMSTINLRGLGTSQTLILIDGHRPARVNAGSGQIRQTDLNGIPLSAVERIEVLPATASGLYGGGATGGVVNVVLRRDYNGVETKLTYESTFDSDVARRQIDLSGGFSLEDGRTSVMFAASYSDNDALSLRDRDFYRRRVDRMLANNDNNYQAFNVGVTTPPAGATPNIRSANGSNLTLRNGTALGSPITFVPAGYAGIAGDGGAALAANAGRYNLDFPDTAQQQASGGRLALLAQPTTESGIASIRREFHRNVEAFLDVAASNITNRFRVSNFQPFGYAIPASSASNPFNQDILVTLPLPGAEGDQLTVNRERRVIGGLIFKLPSNWHAQADYTWSRSSHAFQSPGRRLPRTFQSGVGTGSIEVLRDTVRFPVDLTPYLSPTQVKTPTYLTSKNPTLRFSGPIGELPAGAPVVSFLVERRDETLSDAYEYFVTPTSSFYYPGHEQSTDSVYAEVRLPLIAARNNVPGVQELELQLAARHDQYTIQTSTPAIELGTNTPIVKSSSSKRSTDPTVGLRYQPLPDLTLRASYGTGFLPPSFSQLLPFLTEGSVTVIDPRRGNTSTLVLPGPDSRQGGNPNVNPESSESLSAGFILTPRLLPGWRLSVDWTRIDKIDNIVNFADPQAAVNNEQSLPGRITRGPNLPGDPAGWAGPISGIDYSAVNLAQSYVEAYDVALDYEKATQGAGTFAFYALATWQTHLKTKVLPGDPLLERVGVTSGNPLRFRANAGLTWELRRWTLGWQTSYFDSYYVASPYSTASRPVYVNQGSRRVESQMYHDLFVGYRFGKAAGGGWASSLLANTELQFGIENVFNKEPPFDVAAAYSYSAYGDPRMARYYLSIRSGF